MVKKKENDNEYYVIDVLYILKSLWRRAWAILLISIVGGGMALLISVFCIAPKYSSSVMMYVNNSSISMGNPDSSISSSDLLAAQSLANTYIVILNSRTTLEQVIAQTDVEYTYEELAKLIHAEVVNDTEVFKVTVTTKDPYEAKTIADGIADVLPPRVEKVIEGSSMRVFDYAVVDTEKVSPSHSKNTLIGAVLGFVAACGLFAVIALFDDTIRGDDFVRRNFDVPILAKIPNFVIDESAQKKYAYYYSYNSYKADEPEQTVTADLSATSAEKDKETR